MRSLVKQAQRAHLRRAIAKTCLAILVLAAGAARAQVTYTTDADFNLGVLNSVNVSTPGQLALDSFSQTEPFIYIADPAKGIVLKLDTRTGAQVARYDSLLKADCASCPPVASRSLWSPSRTAVDLDGNVWVANRAFNEYGAITKISSSPGGCVDRDGDGAIETSHDANGDGLINPSDPAEYFGQADECIVKSIPVGGYNAILRALAIDANGKIWVGLFNMRQAVQIDPAKSCGAAWCSSGSPPNAILSTISLGNINPYGFAIRGQYLYVAGGPGSTQAGRVDLGATPTPTLKTISMSNFNNYGVTVDGTGIAWYGNYYPGGIWRCDFDASPAACTQKYAKTAQGQPANHYYTGIVVDANGDIWAGAPMDYQIVKFSGPARLDSSGQTVASGTYLGSVTPTGCTTSYACMPYGMAIAHDGAVWAAGRYGGAMRVDPGAAGGPPGAVTVYTTGYPAKTWNENYSYSDMTGYLLRNITVQEGSWTVFQDAGFAGAIWGTVSWNAEPQGATPAGTSITARVRAADAIADLESRPWVTVQNGVPFSGAGVSGQYLQVRMMLIGTENASPVLSDVTIAPSGAAPGTACTAATDCASGFCVDDVCCTSACTGQCEACNLPAAPGTCSQVLGAPLGGRPACASDGGVCGGACGDTLREACTYPGAETACRAASCASGVATAAAVCGGAGSCPLSTSQCSPYVCGAEACLGACAGDADCAVAFLCEASACVPDVTPPTVTLQPIGPYLPSSPVLTGTVADRGGVASAAFFVNGTEHGVTPAPDGTVTLDTTGMLVEGENTILLSATDRAGNTGSAGATFALDTKAPVITILSPIPGAAFGTSGVPVQVHVEDRSPGTVTIGSTTTQVPPTADASGTISIPAEGPNTLTVTASDAAGNTAYASVAVLLDFSAPIVGSDLVDQSAFAKLPGDALLFHLRVDDWSATTALLSDGQHIAFPRGGDLEAVTYVLAEGRNGIGVAVTDETGHATAASWTIVYDLTPPAGSVTSPGMGTFVRGTIDLAAEATDALTGLRSVTFQIAGSTVGASPAGGDLWTGTFDTMTVADGEWTATAVLADRVGNSATTAAVQFTIDNTAPTVTIETPADGAWARGTIPLTASAYDGTSGVEKIELFVGDRSAGACDASPCTVSYNTTTLANGPFVVRAIATDRSGNAATAQVTPIADNTAPSKFLVSPANGAIVAGTLTVTVDVRDDAFAWAACYLDNVLLFRTTEPSHSQTISLLDRLDGPLAVRCDAADQAGNVGIETANVTIRNWTVVFEPNSLKLGTGAGTATVFVGGPNVALLLPIQARALALVVPGGSPVPALLHPASATVHDGKVTLKFERPPLVAAIRAGMSTGAIDSAKPLVVSLYDGNRLLGWDTIRIIP